jgi:hypothetical protein
MFPAQEGGPGVWMRNMHMKELLGEFEPSDLGKKLFGLQSWNNPQ